VAEPCALGCSDGEPRCLTFEPVNGLGPALAASAQEPDVQLPPGTRIDTDTGVVQDVNGTAIPVKTMVVNQAGGPPIQAFLARSFTANDLSVTGTNPLALVARGSIVLNGRVNARATGVVQGPGASPSSSCAGADSRQYACSCTEPCSVGAGGGGNTHPGGRGGAATSENGGTAVTAVSPLVGGCAGGSQLTVDGGSVASQAGGGGGAIQIVSQTNVVVADQGLIDVGGGGGRSTAGGGSGGLVIIEAPEVSFLGPASGVVANGGAGGGCFQTGPDGTVNTSPAPGAVCTNYFAGSGGTGTLAPGNGCIIGVDSCEAVCPVSYGGGGGSVGRMWIRTRDGNIVSTGNPILSVNVSKGMLTPK